ncbi:putative signal transduction protein with CBS domains [Pyrolobus fumarii 1A]|uniref:Putative signal transduction protein with CBS domains n=1 Tax=Pyrolobus fumarii (strain DSM 11204 / 1A) TaxID=694429 RepID=G0ECW1_PYRF1|nr:CBS domain-containing protein [Pyrolobus fumarii]AEM39681.1 putative signal transduction protein with CBS domains [Pyrolobus fumarii 1A]
MARLPSVAELARTDYPVLDKDETLRAAWEALEKKDFDKLLAFEDEKLVGILTLRDVMLKLGTERTRTTVPGRLHISSFMSTEPIITIKPDAKLDEAARMILENHVTIGTVEASIGILPVVEDGKVVGVISKWEIAKFVAEHGADAKASDVMTVKPFILRWTDRVLHARQLMAQNDISFIPVVDEEDHLMGYITVYEVAYALMAFHEIVPLKHQKIRIQHLLVHDVMRLRPPRVQPDTPLAEVAKAILEKGSRGAVVVQDDKIVGIVTLDEIAKYVAYNLGKS